MRFIRKIYRKITGLGKISSRELRLFVSNKIVLNLVRLLVLLIVLLALFCLYIYIYKPHYIDKAKNRSIYLLSKYTDINFNKFTVVTKGTVRSDKEAISRIIQEKYQNKKASESLNEFDDLIKEIKQDQKWIDSIHIFRSLPNKINVNIVEFVPFALWKDLDKYYVVDSNGQIIPIDNEEEFDYLIVLSGKNAYLHVKSIFNIMAINPQISARIYSATWVGNRRWDLRLDNSLLIKLPSSKITNSWNKLVRLYNTEGSFYNLKVIDLRIKNKIYLEYKD